MMRWNHWIGSTVLLLLFTATGWAADGLSAAPETCLECHADSVATEGFAHSVHGQNACTSCHVELVELDAHLAGTLAVAPVACERCHVQAAQEHAGSVHQANGIDCAACHADIHQQQRWQGEKPAVVARCQECHASEAYQASVHGRAVAADNPDAAACHDCHGLHAIAPLSGGDRHAVAELRTSVCIDCHADPQLQGRNGLTPHAVATYLDSYHGKNYRLGFAEQAAGCADCHRAHDVLPRSDPASSLHGANLVTTCGQCHAGASGQFAKFYAHGDHADRANYPLLWWTYVGMTGLLAGTFAVFWVHTLLWMFRGFVENRQKEHALALAAAQAPLVVGSTADGAAMAALTPGAGSIALEAPHAQAHVADGHKLYRRFDKRHIFLHLTVIVSFLGLSLTGLPLKFSGEPWAKTMMSFYGGVHYAGLIHRGCAIITFYYFVSALLMSVDFLFVRKDVKGIWLQRLFGPDSLMPNFKDLRDIRDMVKWFLFRGPKPSFERWTYWEKFDFLAVFWGMFAIGGSGLLLWFPEWFGALLPGWMFNIATIVHSDEALLATGFIFTVHFFNTHGRPEKFPMDFVIFNGQLSKEEFLEERADQWRRYEQDGVTEAYLIDKPSGVLYDFLFKGFGFLALFTGLTLAFLMLFAFIKG